MAVRVLTGTLDTHASDALGGDDALGSGGASLEAGNRGVQAEGESGPGGVSTA